MTSEDDKTELTDEQRVELYHILGQYLDAANETIRRVTAALTSSRSNRSARSRALEILRDRELEPRGRKK